MRFTLYTLVDITETNARRGDDPQQARQQQNYLTVMQTIGLRVNPTYVKSPEMLNGSPKQYGLGESYKNKHNIWKYTFDVDYEGALTVETLVNDFDLIPIISGLHESAKFNNNVFLSKNPTDCNIVFELNDK